MNMFKKPYFLKTVKEKQLDFINDTINHFNINNRGVDLSTGLCSYEKGCAIGRYIPDIEKRKLFDIDNKGVYQIYEQLPKKLKKLGRHFLQGVQEIHDRRDNWTDTGLSEIGKKRVEQIKNQLKTLKEKQLDFLNDTVNHFNSTNRSYMPNSTKCSYEHGCAIGRHLDKKLAQRLDKLILSGLNDVFDDLPTELKDLRKSFLCDMQNLHDNRDNWNETGLSSYGKTTVALIKNRFNL